MNSSTEFGWFIAFGLMVAGSAWADECVEPSLCSRKQPDDTAVEKIVRKHEALFTAPPQMVPTNKTVDGPFMGNGDLGVVISGEPEAQKYYLSKCDFWKAKAGNHKGGAPKVIGGLEVLAPALKGASYQIRQRLWDATAVSTFGTEKQQLQITTWLAAQAYLMVLELKATGQPLEVEVASWVAEGDESTTEQKTTGDTQWLTRAYYGKDLEWHSAATVAIRPINAKSPKLTLQPGKPVTFAVTVRTNHDTKTFKEDALAAAGKVTMESIASERARHEAWWSAFWGKAQVEIPDQLLEKYWYASLYVMGSCSRNNAFPPGLFGAWITTDKPAWAGDYHLNYNHQAAWWGCYSSNHIDLTTPYDTPLLEFMPRGRYYARRDLDCGGIYYPVGIGPRGLETTVNPTGRGYKPRKDGGDIGHFLSQKYNAAYGAVNMSMRFYHTYDKNYAEKVYPYLKEVGQFWEDRLKFNDGRYEIHEDCLHEAAVADDVNPTNCMAMVIMNFRALVAMSKELDLDADRRKKWQHILDNFSEFPTFQYKGKTLFDGAERGTHVNGNIKGWPIVEQIFPASLIGLDSDPKLVEISKNNIRMLPAWHHNNCVPMIFTSAARVGYDPKEILKYLNKECRENGLANLQLYHAGGGIENSSAVPSAINEMLMQSHEGVVRVFPVWPKEMDARFSTLRAWGAFLVSSELKDGQVSFVKVTSEKGRDLAVENPWPT